jgi:hypothetical protein
MKNNYVVFGRRWFDKINGNTYHSVEVYENNKFLNGTPFEYGYDDAYKQTAIEILKKLNIIKSEDYRGWLRENVLFLVCDVSRRKDL